MLALAAISLMTPLLSPAVFDRWFRFPETLAFMLLPLLMLVLAVALFKATARRRGGAVPLILLYTIYVYRVFGGKTTEAGYVTAGRQHIR